MEVRNWSSERDSPPTGIDKNRHGLIARKDDRSSTFLPWLREDPFDIKAFSLRLSHDGALNPIVRKDLDSYHLTYNG